MGRELADLDATAQAELVRAGELTPLELVDAAIARVEELNPQLNAVIHELFDEGRAAAEAAPEGAPFRGVPFLLKDLGATFAGQPYHFGMRLLKEAGFRAPVDTYLAERFRAAGFATIGKTNTPEMGILPTTEPRAYGPTRNPWDLERSTGGSSGGSAAAVASGMVPVAHANDGGGSIRIPASECGLVGLKPTRQRISEGPLIGDNMSGLTVELCVSRSVRDTAAILDAVQGPMPGDPYVAPPPERPYVDELESDPGSLRIAVFDQSLDPAVEIDPACVAATAEAAKLVEGLGHSVERLDVGALESSSLIDTFLVRWSAGQAAVLSQLAMLVGRPVTADDVEPLSWALAEEGWRRNSGEYLGAVAQMQLLSRFVAGWHASGIDLLLTPTLGEPPPPLGTFDDSGPDPMAAIHRARKTANFTALFNSTGQPAISLPLHWTAGQSTAGASGASCLPVGIQFVSAFGREDLLIRIAAQLERERPWAERRPPVFAAAG